MASIGNFANIPPLISHVNPITPYWAFAGATNTNVVSSFTNLSTSSLEVSSINGFIPSFGQGSISTIGADANLTGSSTIVATYTTSGAGGKLTDLITFEVGHTYNLSWNFTLQNTGAALTGNETAIFGFSLATLGGSYYTPPASVTLANTDDGALLTGSMFIIPGATVSDVLRVSFVSPNQTSNVTSTVAPGLSGGYRITLTDLGMITV